MEEFEPSLRFGIGNGGVRAKFRHLELGMDEFEYEPSPLSYSLPQGTHSNVDPELVPLWQCHISTDLGLCPGCTGAAGDAASAAHPVTQGDRGGRLRGWKRIG